ncbi:integrase, catalytic region, zinc finger, CCHC-type containing protein [Tanacetum coccineum]
MGIVRFGNDHFAVITGYGDHVQRNLTIWHVYYVEGLGHNLFSVKQFCDGYLEVAFHLNNYYVRNLKGEDLLTGSRDSNLYTISIFDLVASSLVCLVSKATSIKSWLWHRILSHLNFGTINQLTKKDLVDGFPKFKYNKDHQCSAYEQGKSKKATFPPKTQFQLLEFSRFIGRLKIYTMSKEYLDNLFGPLYEEYYATRSPEVSDNSAVITHDNEGTPSSSSFIVEENEAPQIVTSLEEQVANKPITSVSNENVDESVQEDVVELDKNAFYNLFHTPVFEAADSS